MGQVALKHPFSQVMAKCSLETPKLLVLFCFTGVDQTQFNDIFNAKELKLLVCQFLSDQICTNACIDSIIGPKMRHE